MFSIHHIKQRRGKIIFYHTRIFGLQRTQIFILLLAMQDIRATIFICFFLACSIFFRILQISQINRENKILVLFGCIKNQYHISISVSFFRFFTPDFPILFHKEIRSFINHFSIQIFAPQIQTERFERFFANRVIIMVFF